MTETVEPNLAELRAERALFRNRILETVAEIRELLEEDLEQFVLRSVRAAFVNVRINVAKILTCVTHRRLLFPLGKSTGRCSD